ncbi:MAG: mercury(II) reductase [Verrucomicrobiota bacterium]|nr:mercury(II) reductase [Chthoniobacterales bacterium]MDQ3414532.1 mercury(II) reductase [Verrucomicrobiota bacterium]
MHETEGRKPPAATTSDSQRKLVILGGGSAAFSAALKAADLGVHATIINDGLPMGGTCVNVGCVPSKTLIRAAEALHRAVRPPPFAGIETSGKLLDFKAVIDQRRELVEGLREAKYANVIGGNPNITFLEGRGRLVDARTVQVNGREIRADAVLIATGARPSIAPVPGLESVKVLTNESAFELDALPESLIVLGGRYIALELAQMFARMGSKVTVLQRSARILPDETSDLTDALTGYLREEGLEIVTGVELLSAAEEGGKAIIRTRVNGAPRTFSAARVLAATGRAYTTGNLGLETVGVATNADGSIQAGETLETSVPGIYAAGDVLGENLFVYTAAYEGALAAENALNGSGRQRDYTGLPWVIFTDPQVAGVGLNEKGAAARGIEADATLLPLTHVPRSLAARDTRGFIKLVRERATDRLLGARILAPEGSELLMEISLAIKFGITARQLASSFHPYLTLSEGVKLAALTFDQDVEKLSCCAG